MVKNITYVKDNTKHFIHYLETYLELIANLQLVGFYSVIVGTVQIWSHEKKWVLVLQYRGNREMW